MNVKRLIVLFLVAALAGLTGGGCGSDSGSGSGESTPRELSSASIKHGTTDVSPTLEAINLDFTDKVRGVESLTLVCGGLEIPIRAELDEDAETLARIVLERGMPFGSRCSLRADVSLGGDDIIPVSIDFSVQRVTRFSFHATPDDPTNRDIVNDNGTHNAILVHDDTIDVAAVQRDYIDLGGPLGTVAGEPYIYMISSPLPKNITDSQNAWTFRVAPQDKVPGGLYSTLLLDSAGRVNVIHTDGHTLYHSVLGANGLSTAPIDSVGMTTGDRIACVGASIDSGDVIHMVYLLGNRVKYRDTVGADEVIDIVSPTTTFYEGTPEAPNVCRFSVARDEGTEEVHASYFYVSSSGENRNLGYGLRTSAGWSLSALDTTGVVGRISSLAVRDGVPFILYSAYGSQFKLLYRYDRAWRTGPSFSAKEPTYAPLVFDDGGVAHTAYYSCAGSCSLTYGTYRNILTAGCLGQTTGASCAWETSVVDSTPIGPGVFTSLAVDSRDGAAYFAYRDENSDDKDLKFAYPIP